MKAALGIWGAGPDLFRRGYAKETNDAAIVKATMATPGIVLKRAVGSKGAFKEKAELPDLSTWDEPEKKPAPKARVREPEPPAKTTAIKTKPAKPEPVRPTAAEKAAKRKAARQYAAAQRKRERDALRAEVAERKERERREEAIRTAKAALEKAQAMHDRFMADTDKRRAEIDRRARNEDNRWREEKQRLEAALQNAQD